MDSRQQSILSFIIGSVIIGSCLIIFTALSFGFFFGLNYPEILKQSWSSTSCTVKNNRNDQSYQCYTDCTYCITADTNAISCRTLINVGNGYYPKLCQQNANASYCPPINSACGNGYRCCNQCCGTYCTSCTTTNGKTTCTSYCCGYYCCSSSNNNKCYLRCPIHTTVYLDVSYNIINQTTINSAIKVAFGTDQTGAAVFQSGYPIGKTFDCYYNPNNWNDVILPPQYTTWKWVLTGLSIGGLSIFVVICILFTFSFFVVGIYMALR